MAPKFTMRFATADFIKALRDYPPTVAQSLGKRFYVVGQEFIGRFTQARLTGRPGLKRPTGTLARSLFAGVTGSGGVGRFFGLRQLGVFVKIGGNAAPYAGLHEEGGPVRGKPFLTIPIPGSPAMTRAGASRYNRAKDVPGLFVIKSKRGNLLLVKKRPGRKGKAGDIQPWYVLKRSVVIPPRLEFEKSWNKDAPMMTDQLQEALDDTVKDF